MQTSIGAVWRGQPRLALLAGATVVAVDVALVLSGRGYGARLLPAVGGAALLLALARDPASVGLRIAPVQGWRPWVRWTLLVGLALGAAIAALGFLWHAAGWPLPAGPMFAAASEALPWLVHGCVLAPLVEELVYRLALVAPAAATLGAWPAVFLSGAIFAALHAVYGNPSPENALGGFVLAWAFAKGGSLPLAIGLHALGNLCVAGLHVAWLLATS